MTFSEQEKLKVKEVLSRFGISDIVEDDHVETDEIQYDSSDELSLDFLNKIQEEFPDVKITFCGNYECGVSLFFRKVL
jgi:hypothetical protein